MFQINIHQIFDQNKGYFVSSPELMLKFNQTSSEKGRGNKTSICLKNFDLSKIWLPGAWPDFEYDCNNKTDHPDVACVYVLQTFISNLDVHGR